MLPTEIVTVVVDFVDGRSYVSLPAILPTNFTVRFTELSPTFTQARLDRSDASPDLYPGLDGPA
jgi:hypothetical protein